MTTCFVEEHSAAALFNHHWQCTRRRWACFQFDDCLFCCAKSHLFYVVVVEQFETNSVTKRVVTGLHAAVATCNHADTEQCAYLIVCAKHAVAVCNENALERIAVSCRHLHNCAVYRTCCGICPIEQLHFAGLWHIARVNTHVVDGVSQQLLQRNGVHATVSLLCCGCCCFGCSQQTTFRQV